MTTTSKSAGGHPVNDERQQSKLRADGGLFVSVCCSPTCSIGQGDVKADVFVRFVFQYDK